MRAPSIPHTPPPSRFFSFSPTTLSLSLSFWSSSHFRGCFRVGFPFLPLFSFHSLALSLVAQLDRESDSSVLARQRIIIARFTIVPLASFIRGPRNIPSLFLPSVNIDKIFYAMLGEQTVCFFKSGKKRSVSPFLMQFGARLSTLLA